MELALKLGVLALNKSYIPVGIITLKKALKKVIAGKAHIVHVHPTEGYYEDYDITSWAELSELKKMLDEELSGHEDWINTSGIPIEAPRIIRFLEYDKVFINKVRFSRKNVFIRDNYTCQYCDTKTPISKLHLEHVIPRAQGGKTTWANTVCACEYCDEKKRDRTPEQAGMKLIRKPFAPKFLPEAKTKKFKWDKNKYHSWSNFISDIYWNVELIEE